MNLGISSVSRLLMLFITTVVATFGGMSISSTGASQAVSASSSSYSAMDAVEQITGVDGVIRFEVAEDGNRFFWDAEPEVDAGYRFDWDGEPVLTENMPAMATLYVTQGYIYPPDTLIASNGVLDDGSAEFPDLVLGQWVCYGWWIGDPLHNGDAAPWITTHLFNFGNGFGEATLVSEGYSINDTGVSLERAIVGGTGPFAFARGIQSETNLGFNESNGLNVQYEVHLES